MKKPSGMIEKTRACTAMIGSGDDVLTSVPSRPSSSGGQLFVQKSTEIFLLFGVVVGICGLISVVYVLYRFMREDHARWKQVTTEIVKHRNQFEQLTSQIKQMAEEQKSTDHQWVEEIKRMVVNKNQTENSTASRSIPVKHIRPTVVLNTPVILTEHDMDQVLAEELEELQHPTPPLINDDDEGRVLDETT